jgi:4-amino-4-deoxy-L-arabinose transferase-like glycosyltransferase
MKLQKVEIPEKYSKIIYTCFVILLIALPLFYKLGDQPLRMWDESRLAINAYEMYHNHDWLVTHFGDKPDMWNTKPPLMIWFQVASMKIFGVNEFAVRFPSALAALITCIFLILFLKKYLGNWLLPIIASFILITSQGYVGHHVSRTGDYDTLLVLFTTLYCLFFFQFTESRKPVHLYFTFLFIALSVLTKSIAGLLFLPALFLYIIIAKQFLSLLKNKHFYFGLIALLGIVGAYYLLREMNNPGYLQAVYNNELGGRYVTAQEMHSYGFLYYYHILFQQFAPWFILVPAGLFIGLLYRDKRIKNFSIYLILLVVIFFLIISKAQTKLAWYDAPLMPFFAMGSALLIYFVYDNILKSGSLVENKYKPMIGLLIIVLILALPYKKIVSSFENTEEYQENANFYVMSEFLRSAVRSGDRTIDSTLIVYDAQTLAHIKFYMNLLAEQNINTSLTTFPDIKENQLIITGQQSVQDTVNKYYNTTLIRDGDIKIYRVIDKVDSLQLEVPPILESYSDIKVYTRKKKQS